MRLELFTYWRSSCSYRVRIALAFKGLSYESHAVNLLEGAQQSPAFLAKNPMGFVPCLVVDGVPFTESVAIIELLEDLAPTPALLPRDASGRARVRALVETINAGTQPLQNLSVLKRLSPDPDVQREWSKHFIALGLRAFEAHMERNEAYGMGGPFAYGDAPTMADVFLVPQMYNARRFHVDVSSLPRVVRAHEAALALPAVSLAAPESQPDAR